MSPRLRMVMIPFIGLLIFIGLPLLGWGLADIQGFLGHPVRLMYVVIVVASQFIALIKFPTVGRYREKGEKIVNRQRIALVLLQVTSIAIMIVAPYCDRRSIGVIDGVEAARYWGLAMFSFGFFVTLWAEAFLAEQFSLEVTIQKGHRLVTDGPYRYLRHPRYVGVITFAAGFSLVYRSLIVLFFVAAMTVVLIWRIHDEEALLHQEFGLNWENYAKRSWRIIPFVY